MEVDEARERMREIQRIMETATLFTLLPGTAAIVGGLLVLVGCGISYWLLHSLSFGDIVRADHAPLRFALPDVVRNRRGQRCRERVLHPAVGRPAADRDQFASSPGGHFRVDSLRRRGGGAFVAVPDRLAAPGDSLYRPGLDPALRHGSLHGRAVLAPRTRILGLAFLLAGIVALFAFPDYGVISVAASFGLLHVVFGAYVLTNQRQVAAP